MCCAISLPMLTAGASLNALAQGSADSSSKLEEVIVTAQKRNKSLQDTPLSIQAITAEQLENLGVQRFEDFVAFAPSVSFVSSGPGTQNMFMRGVSDGSNPNRPNTATSTLYLDEQPLTVGGTVVDLHSYDIDRYEVLNGPQGTYFGASSVSGTVRIITNKPELNKFSAGFDLTGASMHEGAERTTLEGFVNLPLGEKTALRLTGWRDDDGGFIDNIQTTRAWLNGTVGDNSEFATEDYNESEITGGRAAIRTELNEDWAATLSGFYQEADVLGAWDHDPNRRGDLQVSRFGPDTSEREFGQGALTVEGSTAIADIVLATAYFKQQVSTTSDYSDYVEYSYYNAFVQQFACDDFYFYGNIGCNDPRMTFNNDYEDERWSTEIRATSNGASPLQWIAGIYYEKNEGDSALFWDYPGVNHSGAPAEYYISLFGGTPLPREWFSTFDQTESEQFAAFGEVSYRFTDAFTGTLGLRVFDDEFESAAGGWSSYFYEPKGTSERISDGTDGESWKVNFEYRLSDDVHTYFNYAEGFRAGGSNGATGQNNPLVPETFAPDFLDSFEIGVKSTLADGRITLNGALFHMIWEDFQTSIFDLAVSPQVFFTNAGDADITGAEIDLRANLTQQWYLDINASVIEAELTSDFPSPSGLVETGTRLPYVPEVKFATSTRYEFELLEGNTGYAQVSYSYTGDTTNELSNVAETQDSYGLLDARLGWQRKGYTLEFFGTNLTDERAEIFINRGFSDERITTNRPRTFGLRLIARFE